MQSTMTEGGVCPACVSGAVHDGSPKGKVDKVAGLDAYIAEPDSPTSKKPGIIVIIPDIFGWELINSRLLADDYAEKSGRTVYLPDFMFGPSRPAGGWC
jgi:dienelactone hydrolase